jgi:hypothetical protein
MGAELTVKVDNPFPTANGNFTVNEGGGHLTNATYSFLVVAWYNGSDESDNDYAGWKKTQTTAWENLTTDGGDDSITMQWTAPVDATGTTRYPSHYSIYYQGDGAHPAATFTLGNPATLLASVTGTTVTYTWENMPTPPLTTPTFAVTDTNFTINPILDISPALRQQTVRCFDGRLAKKSYAHVNPVDYLDIKIVGMSLTHTNYKKLMKYCLYSIPCRLADDTSGSDDADPFIAYWYGRFIDMPDYIGSQMKNAKDVFLLRFRVETATRA